MNRRKILILIEAALAVLLLAAGVAAAWWFTSATPPASLAPTREAARSVEVEAVHVADHPVRVRAMGTVRPALEAVVRPRVGGMVVEQHPAFVPGGFFERGTRMLQIERVDYEQALRQRRTEVDRAQAALEIEKGDQAVAREELELLQADIPDINRDLILRIPQVNQAEAQLEAAEAAVERARLDLERTAVRAPFDGHLVSRAVSLGNNVSAGTELATLVGSEAYWVELAVPVASLRWIEAPRPGPGVARGPPPGSARRSDSGDGDSGDGDSGGGNSGSTGDEGREAAGGGGPGRTDADAASARGSRALVRNPRVWGDAFREGHVARIVGRLESGSRLARVVVRVPDPLALESGDREVPVLLLDAFVDVEIVGRVLAGSVALDRELVREGDTVWVMDDDDRLVTRAVEIVHRGRRSAYVVDGLEDGDRVVRTNLQTPVDGMLLREAGRGDEADSMDEAADEAADEYGDGGDDGGDDGA